VGKSVQSYRGFRSNWTGYPSEEPAIVALKSEDGKVSVFVSWNGDTETALWRFYNDSGRGKLLGKVERHSFETEFAFSGRDVVRVYAEAIDTAGKKLVRMATVKAQKEVDGPSQGKDTADQRYQYPLGSP